MCFRKFNLFISQIVKCQLTWNIVIDMCIYVVLCMPVNKRL